MARGPLVSVRILPDGDRIEITFRRPFSPRELEVVKALPGRRYDDRRRVWTVPDAPSVLETLRAVFGGRDVMVVGGTPLAPGPATPPGKMSDPAVASTPQQAPGRPDGKNQDFPSPGTILQRVKDALTVRGYSPRTRKVYLGHLRRFLLWCGGGVLRLPENPAEEGQAFILELIRERRISRSYQNQMVSALRFLCESVLGEPMLAPRIPRPRKEERLPVVLSQGEVARMLKKARNAKHRALLMLLYSAGLRVGEVVRLKPADLDLDRGLVRVRMGKGRKDRNTLLARRAVEALKMYRDAYPTGEWLFPGARAHRPLTTRTVQRVVRNAAAAAGIEKSVTAHTLRHSFATHLLERGTNLRIIQELLGHKNARTTQVYTHVAQSTIEAIRSPLDDLE